MDGTLTQPMFDFPRIRAELGIAEAKPILEAIAEMSDARRASAKAILHRHEEEIAAGSTLNPGCHEVLQWLAHRSVHVALITRNSRKSVDTVIKLHHLPIEVLVTRDDGQFKPNPAPLNLACERLGVASADAWMIGDGQYDVEAGLAAGVSTVWISHGLEKPFAAEPWRTVRDLPGLHVLFQRCRIGC